MSDATFTFFSFILSLSALNIFLLSSSTRYLGGPGDGAASGEETAADSHPELRLRWAGHLRRACYPRLRYQVGERGREEGMMIMTDEDNKEKEEWRGESV